MPHDPRCFDSLFEEHFSGVARAVARVIHDTSRAEEIAVEAFYRFWRDPPDHQQNLSGWLYRTAIRRALDELRRQTRRRRMEALLSFARVPTPEEIAASQREQEQVRSVLAWLPLRDAELLVLRSHGLSYDELAGALGLNPASVGTLLRRAQEKFRKEYVHRYGDQ